jgi:hypothetical protein
MAAERIERSFHLVWDDFQQGFSVGSPSAKWFYFSAGPYLGDDGIATTSASGLRVVASGTNPRTGQPAFGRTLGQESVNGGLPGFLDHVKWLVYMNHLSSRGHPGFDAVPGQTLACETWMSGRTFGTVAHPFGAVIQDPNDDLRLACCAMNTIDFETGLVFNFFLTNARIYVLYERLPFARDTSGNYAAFTFMIPVAERLPDAVHHLKVAYNKAAGTVRWFVDQVEVYRVDKIGFLAERQYLTLDHGGVEVGVSPNQLACGMGMFTLLDGCRPSNLGLVRLSSLSEYWNPDVGAPVGVTFLDNHSLQSNRLFGQGAQLGIQKYLVSSLP